MIDGVDTASQGNEGNGEQQNSAAFEKPTWFEQLPGELRESQSLAKYPTIGELGKAYLDLEAKGEGLRVPGENATEEERAAYFDAIGVPKEATGYDLEKPNLPEGMPFNEQFEKDFKAAALEAKLSKEQAAIVHRELNRMLSDSYSDTVTTRSEQAKQATETLKQEWKDNFQRNLAIAERAGERLGGEDFIAMLKDTGMNNHPAMVKMLYSVGEKIADDSFEPGSDGNPQLSDEQRALRIFPEMAKQ